MEDANFKDILSRFGIELSWLGERDTKRLATYIKAANPEKFERLPEPLWIRLQQMANARKESIGKYSGTEKLRGTFAIAEQCFSQVHDLCVRAVVGWIAAMLLKATDRSVRAKLPEPTHFLLTGWKQ
jgi:hypothetical protein